MIIVRLKLIKKIKELLHFQQKLKIINNLLLG